MQRPDVWEKYGWVFAALWLVFLVFPAGALLRSEAPVAWRVLGWVALVLFAVLYVYGVRLGFSSGWGKARRPAIIVFFVLVALAALTLPALGLNSIGFFTFLQAYATFGLRAWWHWVVNSCAVVISVLALALSGQISVAYPAVIVIVGFAVMGSLLIWLIGRSIEDEDLRVHAAANEERASVARDVHDLLGHSLTAVKLKAELAVQLVERDPDRARRELEDIVRLSSDAISSVRETVLELRAPDLAQQLEASASTLRSAGLKVSIEGLASMLSPLQSLTAGWILREATTNILRHAEASAVQVEIAPGSLVVRDDGRGAPSLVGASVGGSASSGAASGGSGSAGSGSGAPPSRAPASSRGAAAGSAGWRSARPRRARSFASARDPRAARK